MADEEAVKTEGKAGKKPAGVVAEDSTPPKSKDEMREIPHEYSDPNHNNDWCAVCGRDAGWKAHAVKEEEPAPPKKLQTPAIPTDEAAPVSEPKKPRAPKA